MLKQLIVGADKRSNSFPYRSELQEISEEHSLSLGFYFLNNPSVYLVIVLPELSPGYRLGHLSVALTFWGPTLDLT